ncbi:MAG: ABC transporter substrate-binding protein [Chloroflexi bacterium]|nr:ABC transporter substrate-binding protein [Chloroflexota bacterium]
MNTASHHFVVWLRRLLQASVAGIFVLLAACGAPPTPAPLVTLRFGFFSAASNLPFFVMQEQEFAERNGLQFTEASYETAALFIKDMAAGSLDVGYLATVPLMTAAESGLVPSQIVPVAADALGDPDHPVAGVVVAPSISSWSDLEGQYIGVTSKNSPSGVAITGRLQQEGVHNYTLVEIPIPNLGLAVAEGNVAAACMLDPYLTQSLLRGDGKLLGWVIGGPPFERMSINLIVVKADLYRDNPQAVKAFLRAHLQAVEWINQNPDEARSLLTRRLGLSEEVGQEIILPYWPLDARNDSSLLESMQPSLVEIGILKAPIPASQLYDETLLNEVLAETR